MARPQRGRSRRARSSGNAGRRINATLYEKLNFNFMRDMLPVAGIAQAPAVFAINSSVPAKTVTEFIAHAKHRGRGRDRRKHPYRRLEVDGAMLEIDGDGIKALVRHQLGRDGVAIASHALSTVLPSAMIFRSCA